MRNHFSWFTWIFVIICSFGISYISNIGFINAIQQTPPHTVFVGSTHYWQDGMFYIAQIQEGKHGTWMNTYVYTEEPVIPHLSHWPNIILGKLSAITSISPVYMFHIGNSVLLFFFLIISYYAIQQIFPRASHSVLVFLFFISSTSLMNRLPASAPIPYWPYELWNTPHFILTRFGTIPHYTTQSIIFTLLLIGLFRKQSIHTWTHRVAMGITMILLTILQPIMAAILLATYIATVVIWGDDKDKKTTYIITIGLICAVAYTLINFSVPPYTQAKLWEAAQQVKTVPFFLLKSIGPIIPLVIIGFIQTIKKPKPIERFGMVLLIVGYCSFYSPLPAYLGISNIRILFPGYYFFFAWFAVIGIYTLSRWLTRVTTLKHNTLIILIFFTYLISVSPTIIWEIKQKIGSTYEPNNPLYYLPTTTYQAFTFLESIQPYDVLVLGNPQSFMDIRIPALSGHHTITGPHYATINYEEKRDQAIALFLLQMTKQEAKQWLMIHHVSYILFTNYDGDVTAFYTHYPFCTPVFSTTTATVCAVH